MLLLLLLLSSSSSLLLLFLLLSRTRTHARTHARTRALTHEGGLHVVALPLQRQLARSELIELLSKYSMGVMSCSGSFSVSACTTASL